MNFDAIHHPMQHRMMNRIKVRCPHHDVKLPVLMSKNHSENQRSIMLGGARAVVCSPATETWTSSSHCVREQTGNISDDIRIQDPPGADENEPIVLTKDLSKNELMLMKGESDCADVEPALKRRKQEEKQEEHDHQLLLVQLENAIAETETCSCEWTGEYGDLLGAHLRVWEFHPVPCPYGCAQKIRRRDIAAHKEMCPNNLEQCRICHARIKKGDMENHDSSAAKVHVRILEERLRRYEDNGQRGRTTITDVVQRLDEMERKQDAATEMFRLSAVENRLLAPVLIEDKINGLWRGHNTATWKIPARAWGAREVKRGFGCTAQFDLPVMLRGSNTEESCEFIYCPKGNTTSDPGCTAVYVKCPAIVDAWLFLKRTEDGSEICRYHMINVLCYPLAKGFKNFCKIQDVVNQEEVELNFIVTKVHSRVARTTRAPGGERCKYR